MSTLINNLSKYTLWLLMAASIVVVAIFWLGGSNTIELVGGTASEPIFTDTLIYWGYALGALAVLLVLGISIVNFILSFVKNPKGAIATLGVIVAIAVVFFLAWSLSDGSIALQIPGYEGTDNVGFWSQFAEMNLYLIEWFVFGTIAILFCGICYNSFRKN